MHRLIALLTALFVLSASQIHSTPLPRSAQSDASYLKNRGGVGGEAESSSLYSWQIYPAYTVCTRNIPAGNRIYALMESKLMAYDTEDETITTFD